MLQVEYDESHQLVYERSIIGQLIKRDLISASLTDTEHTQKHAGSYISKTHIWRTITLEFRLQETKSERVVFVCTKTLFLWL